MRVRESTWAAQVPWSGIQGKPEAFDRPLGVLLIQDIEGLETLLNSLQTTIQQQQQQINNLQSQLNE